MNLTYNKECGALPFDHIHVMRYMGTKAPMLSFLIPVLEELAGPGGAVLDLMAGTHSVSYALKRRHPVWGNDVQAYSYIIGMALVGNNHCRISARRAEETLLSRAVRPGTDRFGRSHASPGFFEETYADTYLSREQCREVDTLRTAIDAVSNPTERALYLTALIYAVCYAQSTPGHFAQFLPADHPRVQPLRGISITAAFLEKCDDLSRLVFSPYPCQVTRATWEGILAGQAARQLAWLALEDIRVVYVDPPYSEAQYSRFYHFLDTLVLNDRPQVEYRARYRRGRFKSAFCYKGRVRGEFHRLFAAVVRACPRASLAVSYGSRGLVPVDEIASMMRSEYASVNIHQWRHSHSSLGKGRNPIEEYLVVAKR